MDICRLCIKQKNFLKGLLDTANSKIRQITEKFTQVTVTLQDSLPTNICIDCEEKLVTFELFLLECQRAQEHFLKTLINIPRDQKVLASVKVENDDHDYSVPPINTEIKSEFNGVDDFIQVLNNNSDNGITVADEDDFRNGSDYDDLDDLAIASLKKIIHQDSESKVKNEVKLEEVYAKPELHTSDLVSYECSYCKEDFKSWIYLKHHSRETHNTEPTVYCICGYMITSQRTLYNHTARHKAEHKRIQNHKSDLDQEDDNSQEDNKSREYNKNYKLTDFIDFSCKFCPKKYKGWYKLKSHHDLRHPCELLRVSCKCGLIFKSKSGMYRHVKDHNNPSHSCDICYRALRSAEALEKHKRRHEDKSTTRHQCAHCDKRFKTRECMKSHMKVHIPIEKRRVYVCEICSMRFTTKSAVLAHRKAVHDKLKRYVCDLCGFACGTNGELKQHRAIHSDDRPFQCPKCEKTFKTQSNLKTHLDIHEGTSYACYICNRVLNSKRTLHKHLIIHNDACKHVCPYCGKAFKRRQTLVVHQHIHTGDKPITCKLCGAKFAYASTLRSHRIRCHPEICQPKAGGNGQVVVIAQPTEINMRASEQ